MMNDQEMQFADPEWRPRQGQNSSYAEAEPYNPRPINDDRPAPEQLQWEETPERAYKAQELPPYQAPPVMGSPYRYGSVRPQRRRSPWVWLIAMLIVLSILGGTMARFGGSSSSGFESMKHSFPANHVPFAQQQNFNVGPDTPTVFINDADGNIQVQEGANQNQVNVQTDGSEKLITSQPSSEELNINVPDSGDITVTVPDNTNLVIVTNTGDMNVDNVVGQMMLTGGSGDITMHGAALTGNSTIKSSDGDITFDGQLAPDGNYQFLSSTGSINLSLPSNSAFSLNASAPNGSIDVHNFPQVQSTSDGASAHGNVGNAPRAPLNISTSSGDISLSAR